MQSNSDIVGKTYFLYAGKTDTDEFYVILAELVDSFLVHIQSDEELISIIRKFTSKKRFLKTQKKKIDSDSIITKILTEAETKLSKYFTDIDSHLQNLSLSEKCDTTLSTSREQYLLYMIEIELVNRTNREKFNSSRIKYAFLPHCLHDLDKECLSAHDEIDYICKSCSKNCSINSVSKLMKNRSINAYIWREADLKKIFKKSNTNGESIGAFGIACIPELVSGLRLCAKYNIPAIGVPLDANRCVRWMGDFYPNSVNEKKILSLLN